MKNTPSALSAPHRLFSMRPDISAEDALSHASELLRCATSTAYEAADNLYGAQRDHAMSVMHLVEMAQAMVDGLLDRKQVECAR